MPKPTLYIKIAEEIRSWIASGRLKVGDQIMSIREMCDHYKISSATALRVFHNLTQSGDVSLTSGLGYFVCDPNRHMLEHRTLVCAMRPLRVYNNYDNYGNRMIQGVFQGALSYGYRVMIPSSITCLRARPANDDEVKELAIEIGSIENKVGVILDPRITDKQIQKFILPHCNSVPLAIAGRRSRLNQVPGTTVNIEQCGRELAKFGWHCGGRRFAMIGSSAIFDSELLLDCFKKELAAFGVSPDNTMQEWEVFRSSQRTDEVCAHVLDFFRGSSQRMVLFSIGDELARVVMGYLEKKGLKVPSDYGVLSYGGYAIATQHFPRISCARVDAESLGMRAVDSLVARHSIVNPYGEYKIEINDTL